MIRILLGNKANENHRDLTRKIAKPKVLQIKLTSSMISQILYSGKYLLSIK